MEERIKLLKTVAWLVCGFEALSSDGPWKKPTVLQCKMEFVFII